MMRVKQNGIPQQRYHIPTPRKTQTGQVELLLQYVENLAGRGLSGYESRILLTIVDSIVMEMQEDGNSVSG